MRFGFWIPAHLASETGPLSGEKCKTGQMEDGEKPPSFFFLFGAQVRLFRFLSGGRSGLIANRSCPQAQIGNDGGFSPPTFSPTNKFRQTVCGLPDFSLFGFAQGLAPSMVRASALRNRGWKLLLVFLVGRRRASLQRRFVDYGQTE